MVDTVASVAGQKVDEVTLNKIISSSVEPIDLNMTPDNPEPKKEEPRPVARCKNCGADPTADITTSITDEDKTSFLRAILGQKPWCKTCKLFGDKLKLTFRIRSMADNDIIAEQCNIEIGDGRIPTSSLGLASQVHMVRLRRLQMVASVAQIITDTIQNYPQLSSPEAKEKYPVKTKKDKDGNIVVVDNVAAVAHDALVNSLSEAVFGLLFKEYVKFEQTYIQLMERSVDSDFWQETAGQA